MNTPYFVIREAEIEKLSNSLIMAFNKNFSNGIIGYSFKTNNVPWVIRKMQAKGMWAEVVSSDEFRLALKLGFPYEKIIFNGPVKGHDEFIEAISNGSIVNIDSKRELEWLLECNKISGSIGLRVNFNLESACPNETQCGEDDGRFGFCWENGELKSAIDFIKDHGLKLSGLHMHCSSRTRSRKIYNEISKTTVGIINEYKLSLEYVDVGGGFFGGVEGKPTFDDYFSDIKSIFDSTDSMNSIKIIIEPGISITGASIDYVTSVIDTKNTLHNSFITLDGSRIHIDPLMKKTKYDYSVSHSSKMNNIAKKQTLCGFTCMENDRFMVLENYTEMTCGDIVTFRKVGAYTLCLSPLFIQFFPPVYLETIRGDIKLVREKWQVEQFLGNQNYGVKQ